MNVARKRAPGDLCEKVITLVREGIASGELLPGHCLLPERELSRKLKISRGTVRRGLEQLVQSGHLQRNPGKGYIVRNAAETPVNGSTNGATSILFVHEQTETALTIQSRVEQVWQGARLEAAHKGLLTLISSVPADELTPAKAAEIAKVAGGVLCDHTNPASFRTLLGAGVPVVQLNYYRPPDLPVDNIVQDDIGGIKLAVKHLLKRGHRRIGYLDTSNYSRFRKAPLNAHFRLLGFVSAQFENSGIFEGFTAQVTDDPATAINTLLDKGITALVLPHGDLWPRVYTLLAERGITVPGKFGVVSWGQWVDPLHPAPTPTHVTWDKNQMGREGVRRLVQRMQKTELTNTTIVIPTTLNDHDTGGEAAT
jgi:DNA-binding LacI/PurR family transcriptional regulator